MDRAPTRAEGRAVEAALVAAGFTHRTHQRVGADGSARTVSKWLPRVG